MHDFRSYFRLLRLPYQFQLGPIFAWGFLLGVLRNNLALNAEILWRFAIVFLLFHIGAFGGLTALNSFYDRDEGPIGGLWQPPPAPAKLWHFAWAVQLVGLVLLLPFGWRLCAIYTVILLLSLGYSHPRTRWKGHPLKSSLVVAAGQGILDFAAGALIASTEGSLPWPPFMWCAIGGAALTVIAFYPLTQLYQLQDDARRGDQTLAAWLHNRGGRNGVFIYAAIFFASGNLLNALALCLDAQPKMAILLAAAGAIPVFYLASWQRGPEPTKASDFARVHFLLRATALGFTLFIGWMLLRQSS